MKILKRLGSAALCALLTLALTAAAWAGREPYTYRITFHAGTQGKFVSDALEVQGEGYSIQRTDDTITISGLRQGDRVSWDSDVAALLQGSRYYIRGVRLSGRDNSTVDASSFSVEGDRDYVVAYGISGETVSYKVQYQDVNGKQLRKSRTMHGNVGDKPVVAAAYIEGYLPQAYNLTGTLKADETKNVFTFVYRTTKAAQGGTQSGSNTTGGTGDNNGNNAGNAAGTAGNAGNTGNSDNTGDNNAAAQQTQGGETGEEEEDSDEEIPELIDIDEEETPLAGGERPEIGSEANRVGLLLPGVALISLIAVICLSIWWKISDKKKKK